jgi:hypothetical protein
MDNTVLIEIDWDELMGDISDGNVIPVIGNEVYKFFEDGNLILYDRYLSESLLQQKGVSDVSNLTLAETVSYLRKKQNLSIKKIITTLRDIVKKSDFQFPMLSDLAKVEPFQFFANTTVFDAVLEKNINDEREKVDSFNFSINEDISDCNNIEKLTTPVIFNVFGSLLNTSDPALSEEEMLEFTASFNSRMTVAAPSILNALKIKTLLFIGCSYPEWLIRFLLRVLSNQRMNTWPGENRKIIVVNDESDYRPKQFDFLKNYNAETYDGNTAEFVTELTGKWREHPFEGKPKMIFLSYAREDEAAVENFKAKVKKEIKEVDFWFDKEKLFSGNNFEDKITQHIKDAHLFIPFISENCFNDPKRYVVKEWQRAHTFHLVMRGEKKEKYLMPIAIDNVGLNNDVLTENFPNLSIEKVPDGNVSEDFINRLRVTLNLI